MDKKKITCHSSPILEKELKKIKIEWKKLRELIKNVKTSKIQKKFYKSWGEVAIIDQSKNFIAGYTDNIKCITKESIVFGDHTCSIKFINFPFVQGADGIKILQTKDNLVSLKYIYYSMCNFIKYDGKYRRHWSDISNISIPIPSIKEQTKIANFFTLLDKQIQLIERKLELYELRKKYYLNNIFCDDYSNLPKLRFEGFEEKFSNNNLNEICKITKGDQINNENLTNNGKYYYLNGGLKLSGWTDNFNRLGNTISISEGGESCGFVNYNQRNFWSGGHLYTLDNLEDKIDTYFLFSVLKYKQKSIMRLRVGTGLPNIQKPSLSKINIIYPKLEEQTKIANLFSSLDESIQNLKKQKDQLTKMKTYYLNNMFV